MNSEDFKVPALGAVEVFEDLLLRSDSLSVIARNLRATARELNLVANETSCCSDAALLVAGGFENASDSFRPVVPLSEERDVLLGGMDQTVFAYLGIEALLQRSPEVVQYFCPQCRTLLSHNPTHRVRDEQRWLVAALFVVPTSTKVAAHGADLVRYVVGEGYRSFFTGKTLIRVSVETGLSSAASELPWYQPTFDVACAADRRFICAVVEMEASADRVPAAIERVFGIGARAALVGAGRRGERSGDEFPFSFSQPPQLISHQPLCRTCLSSFDSQRCRPRFVVTECTTCYGKKGKGKKICSDCAGSGVMELPATFAGMSREEILALSAAGICEALSGAGIQSESVREHFLKISRLLSFAGLAEIPGQRMLSRLSHGERLRMLLVGRALAAATGAVYFGIDLLRRLHPSEIEDARSLLSVLANAPASVALFERPRGQRQAETVVASRTSGGVRELAVSAKGVDERYLGHPLFSRGRKVVVRDGGLNLVVGGPGSGKTLLLREVIQKNAAKGAPVRYLDFHVRPLLPKRKTELVLQALNLDAELSQLFSELPESKRHGFGVADFDLSRSARRCRECRGAGSLVLGRGSWEQRSVACPRCLGAHVESELLTVAYQGQTIADVLATSLGGLADTFARHPALYDCAPVSRGLGISGLQLGQPLTEIVEREWRAVVLAGLSLGSLKRKKGGLLLLDQPFLSLSGDETGFAMELLEGLAKKGGVTVFAAVHPTAVLSGHSHHVIELA